MADRRSSRWISGLTLIAAAACSGDAVPPSAPTAPAGAQVTIVGQENWTRLAVDPVTGASVEIASGSRSTLTLPSIQPGRRTIGARLKKRAGGYAISDPFRVAGKPGRQVRVATRNGNMFFVAMVDSLDSEFVETTLTIFDATGKPARVVSAKSARPKAAASVRAGLSALKVPETSTSRVRAPDPVVQGLASYEFDYEDDSCSGVCGTALYYLALAAEADKELLDLTNDCLAGNLAACGTAILKTPEAYDLNKQALYWSGQCAKCGAEKALKRLQGSTGGTLPPSGGTPPDEGSDEEEECLVIYFDEFGEVVGWGGGECEEDAMT